MGNSSLRARAGLNWVDYGGEGPPMVLVHGLGGSLANWDAVGLRLAKRHHVLAFDLPGFGHSPPRANYQLSTYVKTVVEFIEATGGPVTLVGNSMGGLICEFVAAGHPELVDKLVLVAPATPVRLPDPEIDWMTAFRLGVEATPGVGWLLGKLVVKRVDPEALVDLSLRMITHDHIRVPPEVVDNLVEVASHRARLPWTATALNKSAASIARIYRRPRVFVDAIRSITAPTLVIQGVGDRIVSPTAVRWLVSLRKDWTLVHMADTGHTPQLDAPARFCREVETWLDDQDRGALGESGRRGPN